MTIGQCAINWIRATWRIFKISGRLLPLNAVVDSSIIEDVSCYGWCSAFYRGQNSQSHQRKISDYCCEVEVHIFCVALNAILNENTTELLSNWINIQWEMKLERSSRTYKFEGLFPCRENNFLLYLLFCRRVSCGEFLIKFSNVHCTCILIHFLFLPAGRIS